MIDSLSEREVAETNRIVREEIDEYENTYQCPRCIARWVEWWDSGCDSECGECGARHISPIKSTIVPK